MRKYIAIIIASLALCTGRAHAQRCLPKMQGIEVRANMADGFNPGGNDGGYSFGAALSTYTKKGNKWVFGGEYLLKNNPYKDGKIPVAQFTAEGGYYLKILSDARKIVFVYAGASALAGYESVNWGEKVLYDGSTLHDRDAFIYGPQALVGIAAANIATKRAAATAGGFCGLFGYGSTIVSGWGLGMLVQYTDWSIALYTLVGMALVGTAIFAAAWKAKPNGYDD